MLAAFEVAASKPTVITATLLFQVSLNMSADVKMIMID
jgi:hypothetical protein